MKVFDMHIHAGTIGTEPDSPNAEQLLARMGDAGIWGGCVFSARPKQMHPERGMDFEDRLACAKYWTERHPGRLFPVIWIHPYEPDILDKIDRAVDAGMAAFKIICNDFYIYEDQPMQVLQKIAKTGKPVIFHSGILWDGRPSSDYNRPGNWESLLDCKGLKFSMGHCSWPWIDECIAMYGKFEAARRHEPDIAEMFFDLTPGTPPIYRRELLTKLFTVGYHVEDNIMFGMDVQAENYLTDYALDVQNRDNGIYDELGLSEQVREKIYHKNLMRFLGISG